MKRDLTADVESLLSSRGWSAMSDGHGRATLWALDTNGVEMYVPRGLARGSFEWTDVVERIAAAHDAPTAAIERQLALVDTDVMRFRIDSADSQSIPLEAGASVISSAFGMIRAAATTARRPRRAIGSNYSVIGDAIAREAQLAHTEVGSFVFPVLMRVSGQGEDQTEENSADHLLDEASARPESGERRVVRTLAQALDAYQRHVIAPAKEPRLSDLTPVVVAGGSKEIFAHVARTLAEPGVAWFETRFDWAPSESVAHGVPEQALIPAEARHLVDTTVRLLAQPDSHPVRTFTGPITHISHEPDDPFGTIAVQSPSPTARRVGHVEATVRAEQLTQIHHWMDTATTVVVRGELERVPGRAARLRGISEPFPLSDTMLGMAGDELRR
jgi:hypothetical protein